MAVNICSAVSRTAQQFTHYQNLHSQHAIDILICIYPSGIPIEIFFFAESMANRIRSLQRQAPLMPSKLAPGRLVLSSVALACSKSIPYLAQFLWLNKTSVGGRDGGNVYLVSYEVCSARLTEKREKLHHSTKVCTGGIQKFGICYSNTVALFSCRE